MYNIYLINVVIYEDINVFICINKEFDVDIYVGTNVFLYIVQYDIRHGHD